MSKPELSETETAVLEAVQAEGSADLYELARAVGTGPRTVQEAVQRLAECRLVLVTGSGRDVRCTPAGDEYVRTE